MHHETLLAEALMVGLEGDRVDVVPTEASYEKMVPSFFLSGLE